MPRRPSAETSKFLDAAESLAGPYQWGRYDLLLLPPSFPYGGCLRCVCTVPACTSRLAGTCSTDQQSMPPNCFLPKCYTFVDLSVCLGAGGMENPCLTFVTVSAPAVLMRQLALQRRQQLCTALQSLYCCASR